jgi:hypothetical protein
MNFLKTLCIVCTGLLFLALFNLPIGYYTFLRIAVTIGAVAIVFKVFQKRFNIWVILFGIIAILFNPLIPVYLNNKSAWMPIDIVVAILFWIKSFTTPVIKP